MLKFYLFKSNPVLDFVWLGPIYLLFKLIASNAANLLAKVK